MKLNLLLSLFATAALGVSPAFGGDTVCTAHCEGYCSSSQGDFTAADGGESDARAEARRKCESANASSIYNGYGECVVECRFTF